MKFRGLKETRNTNESVVEFEERERDKNYRWREREIEFEERVNLGERITNKGRRL